jgi:hypothetical protein
MKHNRLSRKRYFTSYYVTLLIFLSFTASPLLARAAMDVPAGQDSWTYGAVTTPILDDYASYAEPIGVGTVAESGDTVSMAVQLEAFSGPVDIYLGLYIPSLDPNNIYIFKEDNSLQTLAQGLVPWKKNVTGAVSEKLFGDIPVSNLPAGTYSLCLLITPAGSSNTYYLWVTSFNNTHIVSASDIDVPTTWQCGNVYVVDGSVGVYNTLTIQPCTIVKFKPASYMQVSDAGTVLAEGTNSQPIVFTSYKDDSYGGDTNGDGNVTVPVPGDWDNIEVFRVNGSIFDHCIFQYGGDGTLEIYEASATVTNSAFYHNATPNYGALNAGYANSGMIIQSNRFFYNDIPLYINSEYDIDDSNMFWTIKVEFGKPSTLVSNKYNGIFVNGDGPSEPRQWLATGAPFVITDYYYTIPENVSLTLGYNVIIKFMPRCEMQLNGGPGTLIHHDWQGVVFTSYSDDAHGGDTNGDGVCPQEGVCPSKGDWVGIYDATSYESNPFLAGPNIYYSANP